MSTINEIYGTTATGVYKQPNQRITITSNYENVAVEVSNFDDVAILNYGQSVEFKNIDPSFIKLRLVTLLPVKESTSTND